MRRVLMSIPAYGVDRGDLIELTNHVAADVVDGGFGTYYDEPELEPEPVKAQPEPVEASADYAPPKPRKSTG